MTWQGDPYFQGDISELHVFDYALSDHEVIIVRTYVRMSPHELPALESHRPKSSQIASLGHSNLLAPGRPVRGAAVAAGIRTRPHHSISRRLVA